MLQGKLGVFRYDSFVPIMKSFHRRDKALVEGGGIAELIQMKGKFNM
jgi:hypothetical protein